MARSLMSDEEWGLLAPHVVPASPKSGRRPRSHRQTLDAIFWVAHRQAAWRTLPETFGHWNTVYRQFRRWSKAGVWERTSKALDELSSQDPLIGLDRPLFGALSPPTGTGDLRRLVRAVGSMAYDPGLVSTSSTKSTLA